MLFIQYPLFSVLGNVMENQHNRGIDNVAFLHNANEAEQMQNAKAFNFLNTDINDLGIF